MWKAKAREEEYLRRMRERGYKDSLMGMDDDDIEYELAKMDRQQESPQAPLLGRTFRPPDRDFAERMFKVFARQFDPNWKMPDLDGPEFRQAMKVGTTVYVDPRDMRQPRAGAWKDFSGSLPDSSDTGVGAQPTSWSIFGRDQGGAGNEPQTGGWGIMPSRESGSYRQDGWTLYGQRMAGEQGQGTGVGNTMAADGTGDQGTIQSDGRSDAHKAQDALANMGFDIGKDKSGKPLVDGHLGVMSSSSLIMFQYKMGLKVTGVPDADTIAALNDSVRRGMTYSDIMKMPGRELGIDEDGRNGEMDEGGMTRIPAINGAQGRQHEATAVAWANMVQTAAKEAPHLDVNRFLINGPRSGYRSLQEQKDIQREYAGTDVIVADPGTSPHGWGAAMDINIGYDPKKDRRPAEHEWVTNNAARFGFQPFDEETWHWNYKPGRRMVW